MKLLFLVRDSYDARYILSKLEKVGIIGDVILEKGGQAKKKKLKNYFTVPIWKKPFRIFDLISLLMYTSVTSYRIENSLGNYQYPHGKVSLIVDDANDKNCVEYIKKQKPDYIFVYGTAILKKDFLLEINKPILNIHTGILPYYRNVHSDFWAYINKEYEKIGISIIFLDKGVDTGDICFIKNIKYEKKDSLVKIKIKNLELIIVGVQEIIKMIKRGKLNRFSQKKIEGNYYVTPGFKDIIRILK